MDIIKRTIAILITSIMIITYQLPILAANIENEENTVKIASTENTITKIIHITKCIKHRNSGNKPWKLA